MVFFINILMSKVVSVTAPINYIVRFIDMFNCDAKKCIIIEMRERWH